MYVVCTYVLWCVCVRMYEVDACVDVCILIVRVYMRAYMCGMRMCVHCMAYARGYGVMCRAALH